MISAFVICFNEKQTIKRALDSLYFVDEIIVVDSGSTDGTLDIVKDNPKVKLFHRNWSGFSDQKNFALSQCESDWIFALDADELVSGELALRAVSIVQNGGEGNITCFRVRREEYFLGRHLTGGPGNPSFQERLFKKDSVIYKGVIHEYPRLLKGEYGLLQEPIHHNVDLGIDRVINKINCYTTLEARVMFDSGERASLFHAFGTFFSTFIKNYIRYKGYKNGKEGLVLCFLEGINRSVRHFKLWSLQRGANE